MAVCKVLRLIAAHHTDDGGSLCVNPGQMCSRLTCKNDQKRRVHVEREYRAAVAHTFHAVTLTDARSFHRTKSRRSTYSRENFVDKSRCSEAKYTEMKENLNNCRTVVVPSGQFFIKYFSG